MNDRNGNDVQPGDKVKCFSNSPDQPWQCGFVRHIEYNVECMTDSVVKDVAHVSIDDIEDEVWQRYSEDIEKI